VAFGAQREIEVPVKLGPTLSESSRWFLQHASDGIHILDSEGNLVEASDSFCQMLGYTKAELIGMNVAQWDAKIPAAELAGFVAGLFEHPAIQTFETRHRRKDGTMIHVEVTGCPTVLDGHRVLYEASRDITKRKRVEETLRESLETLKEAQTIGSVGSYVTDILAGVWTSSDVMDGIFGIGKDYDRTVAGWEALVHPGDRAMMAAYFRDEVIGEGKPFNKEYRIVRQTDMAERWVHGVGRLEYDAQGRPVKMRGVIRDITESKLAAMQLSESEERYRATFEQAPIGIVHTSLEGRFLRCNARFAEMIGYPIEEADGLTFKQITAPEDMRRTIDALERVSSRTSETVSLEKHFIRKDGTTAWEKVSISAQRDSEGRVLHFIALVEDINARKQTEELLTGALEALRLSEEHYRTVFQMSLDAITISRLSDGRYIDANKAFLDLIGIEPEEIVGRTSTELGIWASLETRPEIVEMASQNKEFRDFKTQFVKKTGERFWVIISASVIEIGGVSCLLSVVRDITEAKLAAERLAAASEALRTSEERYRTVFQTSLDGVAIAHFDDGMYVDVNKEFLNTLGYDREEVIGHTSLELNIWADERARQNFVELLRQHSQCRNLEVRFRKASGEVFSAIVSASVIEIDSVSCIISHMLDTSSVKAAEAKIKDLAFYDPLTHLPNRSLLLDRLQQALTASTRTGHEQALLFVDLDNFKTLNDTLGHQTGDLLLMEVARRITGSIHETDSVARLGADEFAVLLEDLSEIAEDAAAQAERIAERVLMAIGQTYLLDEHECHCAASIGINVFGKDPESPEEVLQRAELAMYQAKKAGRNTMRFFAPALQAAVTARAALEEGLRKGIKAKQLVLYYQPQVVGGRLIGAEALVRWKHPRRGLLGPCEFIPLAEETGLILPLGDWVLEAACEQISKWADQKEMASVVVAVNISARQLRHPEFVDGVMAVLKRTGANPQALKLELTESMLVDNIEEVIDKMTVLKSHGLRFSLDDFGTGYSSLSYLKRLPLDQLKIDRAFVRDILLDAASGAIAQTLISLGRAMGLSVIAEGVESEEQREFLAGLGCHTYQGFLFGRPVPLQEFEHLWSGARNAVRKPQ
jgi:diguanylate cyclase (GGDEF)-like protein/PAS domain S-box-containing protein